MSILDNNYAEHTDKLFLLGRWIPLTPHVSKFWILQQPTDGSVDGKPIEVDVDYAKGLCNYMFDGKMTLHELWELIGGIEVSPGWISNWNYAAIQTPRDDMGKWNESLNKELIQKIANALVKRFAEYDMHIMTLEEFNSIHIWAPRFVDDNWFCYEPGIILRANWPVSSSYIKIMMTTNGVGFGLLHEDAIPAFWDCNSFVLDLSPEKTLLKNPRDINEFMMYQPTSQGMQTRYNHFNQ